MYRAIIPLAGSPDAEEALDVARFLASTGLARIELVHVLEPTGIHSDDWGLRKDAAQSYLDAITRTFPRVANVTAQVLTGEPVEVLGDLASAGDHRLLVLTPRWSEEEAGFAADSVSQQLLATTESPVLLIPGETHASRGEIRTVLVPFAGTESGHDEVLSSIDWLASLSPMVRLISIIGVNGNHRSMDDALSHSSPISDHGHALESVRSDLLRLRQVLGKKGVRGTWEVRYGEMVQEILRAAETTETDLIVFSAVRPGVGRQESRSHTALSVARKARVPVLVFPSAASEGT